MYFSPEFICRVRPDSDILSLLISSGFDINSGDENALNIFFSNGVVNGLKSTLD